MLGWDTEEAENVWWMAQNNYWMIQAKVHMPKYGGQSDTPFGCGIDKETFSRKKNKLKNWRGAEK